MASCIVCNNTESFHELYKGILKCCCGYVFADLALTQTEFETLYGEDYFHGSEYANYVADKEITTFNFNKRIKTLLTKTTLSKNSDVLEIGCAYGYFLQAASSYFKSVTGIDICDKAIEYAINSGMTAIRTDFLTWKDENRYDAICLWDTIEHLKEPGAVIERASSKLKQNGYIAITTGDIDSIVAKIRGKSWRLIHPPTHAHYFSKETLTRLLNRHGLTVVHSEYCGFYRGIKSVAHILMTKNPSLYRLFCCLEKAQILRGKFYSNFYDIMFLIAQKKTG